MKDDSNETDLIVLVILIRSFWYCADHVGKYEDAIFATVLQHGTNYILRLFFAIWNETS